jgi:hypothetical protein
MLQERSFILALVAALIATVVAYNSDLGRAAPDMRAVAPHTLIAGDGGVRARLVYYPWPHDYGRALPELTLTRTGLRQRARIPPSSRDSGSARRAIPYALGAHPLHVVDLDGDGEPEVMVDLFWGGTRCCMWTRIYRFDRDRQRYHATIQFWGNFQDFYRLRDVDNDGRPELVARDSRIEQVTSTWSYFSPVRVFQYRHGRMIDVTQRFPALVAADARDLYRTKWTRELLSAWVSDQYRLGHRQRAEQVVQEALRSGQLAVPRSLTAPNASTYDRRLHAFLRAAGHTRRS